MKNDNLPFAASSKGYVLIPKMLLIYHLNQRNTNISFLDAFLLVLTNVNFEDREVKINGKTVICHRGESLKSAASWARVFNWKIGKTRNFFKRLEEEKMISINPLNSNYNSIQVINYDLWTGKSSKIVNMKPKKGNLFTEFYDKYHEITGLRKVDRGLAQKEWYLLSEKEMKAAIDNIENYCIRTQNKEFFKSAYKYLRAKSFYDEGVDESGEYIF